MKSCTCASPESPVEAPRPSLHNCDEPNKEYLAPRRLVRKPSRLQTTLEVTRCKFGNTSRQAAPAGTEDVVPLKDWTPICHAVYHDREAALHHFLQSGISPDQMDDTELPLLCIAAARGHLRIAEILLEAGASADATSKEKGETALHIAIRGSQHDIIDLLLVHRIDLEARTRHTGETALHYAAAGSSSLALVMRLLKFGAKYDVQNSEGQTPAAVALQAHNLHAAVAIINMARGKRMQLAKEKDMLLKHVEKTRERSSMTNDLIADVFTATCDPDSTVLVEAIKKNDAGLVEMFLKKGADIHRATAEGLLPIFVAIKFANLEIIKLLVQHGADVTTTDPGNLNLLQVLFKTSSTRNEEPIYAIVGYLFSKGTDGLALYPDGKTLLHRAVNTAVDYPKVVKLLLKYGISIDAQDKNGSTALHLAASNGLESTVSLLLQARADTTIVDSNKETSLICAVHQQRWSIISLLAIPPAITSWDAEGSTALHHMARSIPKGSVSWKDIATATKCFCERGVCRSMRDRSGATPLIQAVKTLPEEGLPVIEVLLREGGETKNCVGHEDHKRRDALHYAATLSKPAFVESLLKHGAPFVLENWTHGTRLSKLPATTKTHILELMAKSEHSRQTPTIQQELHAGQNISIQIIASEERTSSAMSGYRADCEGNPTERNPKPNRNIIKSVTKNAKSTQHLQVPSRKRKPTCSSPALLARTSSKHQPLGGAIKKPAAVFRTRIAESSFPKNTTSHQTVLMNTKSRTPVRNHVEHPTGNPGNSSSRQELQKPKSSFPPRVSGRPETVAIPITSTPKSNTKVLVVKPALPEKENIPRVVAPTLITDSPTMVKMIVPTTKVEPLSHIPATPVVAIPVVKTSVVATNPPKPSTAATTLSETASKPTQAARVDSGISLTSSDTAGTPPTLDRSKCNIDGSAPKAKRQSGDELSSWLAISGMLDRL